MTRQIPWLRVFVEGVVIVVSILLAFGLQAWWEERQDRLEERGILAGIQSEFERYENVLLSSTRLSDGALVRMRRLMDAQSLGEGIPNADSLDLAIWAVLLQPTFDVGGGTLEALIASGKLDLIRNEELRARLSAWQGVIEELVDGQVAVRTFALQVVIPFLARRGVPVNRPFSVSGFWDVDPSAPAVARQLPLITPLTPADESRYLALVEDREFQALVAYRYLWETSSSHAYREAVAATQGVLSLIPTQ